MQANAWGSHTRQYVLGVKIYPLSRQDHGIEYQALIKTISPRAITPGLLFQDEALVRIPSP